MSGIASPPPAATPAPKAEPTPKIDPSTGSAPDPKADPAPQPPLPEAPPPEEPRHEGRTAAEWTAVLLGNDPTARRQAGDALVAIGPRSAAALLLSLGGKLDEAAAPRRAAVAGVLRRLGPAAEAVAEQLMAAEIGIDGEVLRLRLAGRAAFFHPKTEWAVPVLLEGLGSATGEVRAASLEEFRQLAFHATAQGFPPGAERAVPVIAKLLSHQDLTMRRTAAAALGDFGRHAGAAVGALAGRLSDGEASVRGEIAGALMRLGPVAAGAAEPLMKALKDPDPEVRARVAAALTSVDHRRTGDMLAALRGGTADDLRAAAAAVYRLCFHRPAREVVPTLAGAAGEKAEEVRVAALEALGRLEFAADDAASVPAALAAARAGRDDPRVAVRLAAALAAFRLAKGEAPAGVTVALAVLARSESLDERVAAVELLGEMGPEAKSAIEVLVKAAEDPMLLEAVGLALRRIDPGQFGGQ